MAAADRRQGHTTKQRDLRHMRSLAGLAAAFRTCVALLCVSALHAHAATEPDAPLLRSAHGAALRIAGPESQANALCAVAKAYLMQEGLRRPALEALEQAAAAAARCKRPSYYRRRIDEVRQLLEASAEAPSPSASGPAGAAVRILDRADRAREAEDMPHARQLLAQAIEVIEQVGDIAERVRLLTAAAERSGRLGNIEEADGLLGRAAALVAQMAARKEADRSLAWIVVARAGLGQAEEAAEAADGIEDATKRLRTLLRAAGAAASGGHEAAMTALLDRAAAAGRKLPAREIIASVDDALDLWIDAERAGSAHALVKRAERIARTMARDNERNNALQKVAYLYGRIERWDDAARVALEAGQPPAACKFDARRALQLARAGKPSEAAAKILRLDREFVPVLGKELLDDLGAAYCAAVPGAAVADLQAIEAPSLRRAAMRAYGWAAARQGRYSEALAWADAMADDAETVWMMGAREAAVVEIVQQCLAQATADSFPAASAIAERACDKLLGPMKRLSVLYWLTRRRVELGRTEQAEKTLAEMAVVLKGVEVPSQRAEALCRIALLQASLGHTEQADQNIRGSVALLKLMGCSSCHYETAEVIVRDLAEAGNAHLLGVAMEAQRLPKPFAAACLKAASDLPDAPAQIRRALLLGALTSVTTLEYAEDRTDELLEVAQAYHDLGIAPGEAERNLIARAKPVRGRVAPAQKEEREPRSATVRLVFFTSPGCAACRDARELIEQIRPEYERVEFQIETYDLSDPKLGAPLNAAICAKLNVPEGERGLAPAIFGAARGLVHKEITRESLGLLVAQSIGLPGPRELHWSGAHPEAIGRATEILPRVADGRGPGPGHVLLALFETRGCAACRDAHELIRKVEEARSDLDIRVNSYFLEGAARELNVAICKGLGAPERDHLLAPAIFSSIGGLIGKDITEENLARLFDDADGLPGPEDEFGTGIEEGRAYLRARYKHVTATMVIAAGLADGIFNPCAFTVVIFFVSYLAHVGRSRRQIALTGITFMLAVFATYLALGLGLARLLHIGESRSMLFSRVFLVATAVLSGAAAVLSFRDGLLCLKGRMKEMTLRLPDDHRSAIRRRIMGRARMGLTLGATLVLGAVVAMIELPCTGLMYIPVIGQLIRFALEEGSHGLGPVGWLVIYNICLTAPLVLVFVAVYFGATSEQLSGLFRRHMAKCKFALAGVFALLAVAIATFPLWGDQLRR